MKSVFAGFAGAVAGVFACLAGSAAQAEPPLEAYGKLPALEQVTLSPQGDRLAFVTVDGEKRSLAAATTDGKLLAEAGVGDVKLRKVAWAGEDHLLLTYSQTSDLPMDYQPGKVELFGMLVLDLRNASVNALLAHASDLSKMIFGDYGATEIDGRWYAEVRAIREVDVGYHRASLYRVDLDKQTARLLSPAGETADDWVIDAKGGVAASVRYDENTSRWRLLAGAGGGKELIARTTGLKDMAAIGLGRTPETILVEETTSDEDKMYEQPLAGGAPTPLWDDVPVEDILTDPATRLTIGALSDDGRKAVMFDPKLQKRFDAAMKAFPGYHATLKAYTPDFGRMVVFTDGGDDSGSYWLVDIAAGSAKPIGGAYPEIGSKDVGSTRMFAWQAADGLKMDGVLTLPPGKPATNLPVVVMPHGGPIGVHDDVGFDWWAQAFASRGYVVFQPNYRGSGGSTVAFRQAGMGEWGRKMQTDVSDGLTALAKAGIVDSKRACIVGGSYGGYAALAGVTLQHGLYRCAVSYGGVSDLGGMLQWIGDNQGRASVGTRYWRAAIGTGRDMKAYSPADHAAQADAPILLIHGKDDTVVPVAQSRRMAAELKHAGKPVELIELKGEDHWLSRADTRQAMLKAAVAFVEEHDPAGS